MLSSNIFKDLPHSQLGSLKDNRIAVRKGGEILYCTDSSIRYSKTDDDYQLLNTNIDFQIEGIKLNSAGTLLAVYNSDNLVVLNLVPRLTPTSIVKEYTIAHHLFQVVGIKTILWNSTAKDDSNLIVLGTDNIVRSFDLNFSFDEPLKVFNLSNHANNKKGLVPNCIDDPVTITLGSNSSRLSDLLTLYIVDRYGDVFSIYPFLPVNEVVATRDQIEELLNESVLLLNLAMDGDCGADKVLATEQLRFVNMIWKKIPSSAIEVRNDQELIVSDLTDLTLNRHYSIQGPFATQPYPDCLYDDEVTSMVFVNSKGLNLLVIGFQENGFITLLADYKMPMKWQEYIIDSSGDSGPALSLVRHQKSQSKKPTNVTVLDNDLVLVKNDATLFKVSFNITEENAQSVEVLLKGADSYGGSCVIYDRIENKKTTLVLTSSIVHIVEEPIKNHKSRPLQEEKALDEPPSFQSILSTSITTEILSLVQNIKNFKLYIPTKVSTLSKFDEESLLELNSTANSVLVNLKDFHKCGILINYKLDNLNVEFQEQIKTCNQIFEKFVKLRKINNSLDLLVEKQELLTKRFGALKDNLRQLLCKSELDLSTKEKQWFKEISQLVVNFNKSLGKNETLHKQLSFIKSELQSVDITSCQNDEYDWDSLVSTLKQGKRILNSTQSSLNSNLKDLGSQLKSLHV